MALLRADLPAARTHAPADGPVHPDSLERVLSAFVARRDLDVGGNGGGFTRGAACPRQLLRAVGAALVGAAGVFYALLHVSATVGLFGHDMAPSAPEAGTLRLAAGRPRAACRLPLSSPAACVHLPAYRGLEVC